MRADLPALPPVLGRYRIDSVIGTGGMGAVYRAFDPILDRVVALKTIKPGVDDRLLTERLYREAKACGRLDHPHIVTIFDLGEIEGTVFIAMEYLEGTSLRQAIDAGALTFAAKLTILTQILDALHYAHGQGVIHRDIKPSNIHLLPNGSIKLLDFGIAFVARADGLTMPGDVMGTAQYMAPEQLKGQAVDHRVDVYGVGVVAYELLTHRPAFEGESLTEVMLKVLGESPPPMMTSWSTALPDLERIVTRAMAKSVDERYATAKDLKDAIVALSAAEGTRIAEVQADAGLAGARAIEDARTLAAEGRSGDARAVLEQTLRLHPETLNVRNLLRELTPDRKETPPMRNDKPKVATRVRQAPTHVDRLASGRWFRWGAAAAVIVGLGAVAALAAQFLGSESPSAVDELRRVVDQERPLAPPTEPRLTTPDVSQVPTIPSVDPIASAPLPAPREVGAAPAAASPLTRQSPISREGTALGRVQVQALAGGDAELSRSLATRVATALRDQGVGDLGTVSVLIQIQLRDAPFQGVGGKTADWVVTLRTADGDRMLDGRLLGFSELALRNDVVERATDQVVQFLRESVTARP